MNPSPTPIYELTNEQRAYFGLLPAEDTWERVALNDKIAVYYDHDRIMKVLDYSYGYCETDTVIDTLGRTILLPKTSRGKQQKFTVPRLLKIKGSGVEFSGSFQGGNIHVYDHRRNLFFIKSFPEDGDMKNYDDIHSWVHQYIARTPSNYFDWLADQFARPQSKINAQAGDFIAFPLTATEFGFARILLNVYSEIRQNGNERTDLYWFHPRSLMVAPYAYFSTTQQVDVHQLAQQVRFPAICIFDLEVYRGSMPIIGHLPLTVEEKNIPLPANATTCVTIPLTKENITTYLAAPEGHYND